MLVFMQVWTIEVANAATVASAGSWRRAHGEWLVEAALTTGAQEWTWVVRPWGVLPELSFDDEADWLRFRATPAVQAALDAAPDPVNGMWVYSGRGAAGVPRRLRPVRSSDGAPVPEPEAEPEPWQHPLGRRASLMPLADEHAAAITTPAILRGSVTGPGSSTDPGIPVRVTLWCGTPNSWTY